MSLRYTVGAFILGLTVFVTPAAAQSWTDVPYSETVFHSDGGPDAWSVPAYGFQVFQWAKSEQTAHVLFDVATSKIPKAAGKSLYVSVPPQVYGRMGGVVGSCQVYQWKPINGVQTEVMLYPCIAMTYGAGDETAWIRIMRTDNQPWPIGSTNLGIRLSITYPLGNLAEP